VLFIAKFDENDELVIFNDIIADCNKKLNSVFREVKNF
jgi:hypothetical protein